MIHADHLPAMPRPRAFIGRALVLCVLVVAVLLASAVPARAAGQRVALVIANSAYRHVTPLPNPQSDGRLIANALRTAGFASVQVLENQTQEQMVANLRTFRTRAESADVALVYFAGHGIESGGENFLIPVDARIESERDLRFVAVTLQMLQDATEGASRLKVVILDACRTPPPTMRRIDGARRGSGQGLAEVNPQPNSLVVFSARAGTAALDGKGSNSPFAEALASSLVQPGREISLLFRRVRDEVLRLTAGEQEPFTYGSLSSEEFYFIPPAARPQAPALSLEDEAWGLCRSASGRTPCETYLSRFPAGRFAELARARIADLATPAPTTPTTRPTTAPLIPQGGAGQQPAASGILNNLSVAETVAGLGLTVRLANGGQAMRVDAVSPSGLAAGHILPGDEIVAINSAALTPGIAATRQLLDPFNAQGRIKLLIRRGPASSLVILRQP